MADNSRLRRIRHRMPPFVQKALLEARLTAEYHDRPGYQQNDYIGWIMGAKREETRLRRLEQMLYELRRGDVYMKMAHKSSRRTTASHD